MVVARIFGGLGNQMFQYAAARAISLRLGDLPVIADARPMKTDVLREYELDAFHTKCRRMNRLERIIVGLSLSPKLTKPRAVIQSVFPRLGLKSLVDQRNEYQSEFASVTGGVYLDGLWQSPRYFEQCADTIRSELTLKEPPDPANAEMLRRIGDVQSVALHVRRGDYASDPSVKSLLGLCGLDYYRAAIEQLQQRVEGPVHYFVFSDDPAWTKENLQLHAPSTYVSHNVGRKNREDMRLMAACRHFIIPNSTFSWWGAWLSRAEGKVVIAPRQFFAKPTRSDADRIPAGWVQLDFAPTSTGV